MSKRPLSPQRKALDAIEEQGALLVFPDGNRAEPPSLWKALYPRSPMTWAWDADADGRVSKLWVLREELSRSGLVVYSKWYRGRATFFAKSSFVDLLTVLGPESMEQSLRGDAARIYELLQESSPRSTKEIKLETELRGKIFESAYAKAMKVLFEKGLIVGWGEVADGAFPSLACGATKNMFEDLWEKAVHQDPKQARKRIEERWNHLFIKALGHVLKE